MSSPVEQPSLILIQCLADGGVKWIPLDFVPSQPVPVAPNAVVAADTADNSAERTLGLGALTYRLRSGSYASALSINVNPGAATLTANPDDEAKGNCSFSVVAKDSEGNSGERAVCLAINDLDEMPPTITSSTTATAVPV